MKAIDLPSGENAGLTSPMIFSGGRVTSLLRLSCASIKHDAERFVRRRSCRRSASHLPSGDQSSCRPTTSMRAGEQVRHFAVGAPRHRSDEDRRFLGTHPEPGDARTIGRPCGADVLGDVGGEAGGWALLTGWM